jgi:hypothetical protein
VHCSNHGGGKRCQYPSCQKGIQSANNTRVIDTCQHHTYAYGGVPFDLAKELYPRWNVSRADFKREMAGNIPLQRDAWRRLCLSNRKRAKAQGIAAVLGLAQDEYDGAVGLEIFADDFDVLANPDPAAREIGRAALHAKLEAALATARRGKRGRSEAEEGGEEPTEDDGNRRPSRRSARAASKRANRK